LVIDAVGRSGQAIWPGDLAKRSGQAIWPGDLVGRSGRAIWSGDLVGRSRRGSQWISCGVCVNAPSKRGSGGAGIAV
jgi:hypothetical protein